MRKRRNTHTEKTDPALFGLNWRTTFKPDLPLECWEGTPDTNYRTEICRKPLQGPGARPGRPRGGFSDVVVVVCLVVARG